MFERVCLVSYHEVGLKGRNRSVFERRLRDNLDAALTGLPVEKTQLIVARLAVRVSDPDAMRAVAERIAKVPGVAAVALAFKIRYDPDVMEQAALAAIREAGEYETFAVDSRRSNTDHPESSLEMNRRIGAFLLEHAGGRVDLSNPDVTVGVTVTQGNAYVFSARVIGVGGLPVGSSNRVISLLSAGIDSPVATWRMMRRGASVAGVHFSGRPQTDGRSEQLVADIGAVLAQTGGLGRIYLVAFGDLQKEVSLAVPPDLRVIIYRRLMIRVAERIAYFERAKALVTGESLGQVASQTLENIAAVDDAASLPVLRPLIGSDKQEIMAEARAIGTFELSTVDHTDCCTLFMPRTPETHARLRTVLEVWSHLEVERMIDDALASLSWRDFNCPVYRAPRRWLTPAGESGWDATRPFAVPAPTAERQAESTP